MSVDKRVYDVAKQLGISNKELIDKLDSIGIKIKSHSSTLSEFQIARLKEVLTVTPSSVSQKPKAFVVKKAKQPKVSETEAEKIVENNTNQTVDSTSNKPEIKTVEKDVPKPDIRDILYAREKRTYRDVKKVPKTQKPTNKVDCKVEKENVETKRSKYIDTKKQIKESLIVTKNVKSPEVKPKKIEKTPNNQNKSISQKPITRHIISQEIYENKGSFKKDKSVKLSAKDKRKAKEEMQEMISLEKAMTQKHKKKTKTDDINDKEITQVVIDSSISVGDLSKKINKSSADIVKYLMMHGILATVNQIIDINTAKKVVESFDIEVLNEDVEAYLEEELKKEEKITAFKNIDAKLLKSRAPVVSIMGHVDHGKTTLLDSIRASKHKIVSDEVGGITQSIGAYTVFLDDKKIVFVDTPGHEAFTEMRARGAKATDIAILVVAADDGIMPQTIEAINHAKAADVPIVVAVNKIDKPEANPDKIMQQLTEYNLVPEKWGGETVCVEVSALTGQGIDELLEYILLTAEILDLKANPKDKASGVVIEANLDKGKGPLATLLIQNGTLNVGDSIVVGNVGGKVRALLLDSGEKVKTAGPSTPVEILGLNEVPQAGDSFNVVKNEKEMKAIIDERKQKERSLRLESITPAFVKNDIIGQDETVQVLNLIIKANTHGALEAVSQSISQLESREVLTKIVHLGVGDISEADVMLASASNAIILGFTVREDTNIQSLALKNNVTIKIYNIIYQVLEDIEKTMLELLKPEIKEVALGKAEVRQIFTIGKTNKIAGCYVTEGKIIRGSNASIIRNGSEIFNGQIDQLKRFKDDVKEVATGFECGISFYKFNNLEVGDIIEVTKTEEIERTSL